MNREQHRERKRKATEAALLAADPVLTLPEATKYLRFRSQRTVPGLVYKRLLTGRKVRGAWRFYLSDLKAFLEDCRYVTKKEKEDQRGSLFGKE